MINVRTRFPLIEVDSLGDEGLESPEMVVFDWESLQHHDQHMVHRVEGDRKKITGLFWKTTEYKIQHH